MELNRVKKRFATLNFEGKKQTICMHKCQNTYNIIIEKKQVIMIERTLSHWKLVNIGLCPPSSWQGPAI